MTSVPSAASVRRSLGWSLALLAFAQLIYSLDINIVFRGAAADRYRPGIFQADSAMGGQRLHRVLRWVSAARRAADLFGQRRMFIFALWLYALSSLVGGWPGARR